MLTIAVRTWGRFGAAGPILPSQIGLKHNVQSDRPGRSLSAPHYLSFRNYKKQQLKLVTYDNMPVPKLPYTEGYRKENATFNAILAAGAAIFAGTVAIFYYTDPMQFEAALPPKSYRQRTVHRDSEAAQFGWLTGVKDSMLQPKPQVKTEAIPVVKWRAPADWFTKKADVHHVPPVLKKPNVRAGKDRTTLLPARVPYLLVGGGTSSWAAARAIQKHDPDAKILIVTDELQPPYRRSALSTVLWWTADPDQARQLRFQTGKGKLMDIFLQPDHAYMDPEKLDQQAGLALAYGRRVLRLDAAAHEAYLEDGTTIAYEKCLLATGSRPRRPPLLDKLGPDVQSHFSVFRRAEDFLKLEELSRKVRSIAVVGGHALATELANALYLHGADRELEVVHVFEGDGLLPSILPPYLSKWAVDYADQVGIDVRPDCSVVGAHLADNKVVLDLSDGAKVKVDHVVVDFGQEPDVTVAQASALPTDPVNGGVASDTELCCASDVYCAGDCCSFMDFKQGRRRIEYHDHAEFSGKIAGENMVGLTSAYSYIPVFGSTFGPSVSYTAVGDVDSSLSTVGYFKTDKGVQMVTTNSTQQQLAYDEICGLVFYLRNSLVVGVLLWNLPNSVEAAKTVVRGDRGMNVPKKAVEFFDLKNA